MKMPMNGRKRTELVQSTRLRKKTRMNKAVLWSTPPMLEVLCQNVTIIKDDAEPKMSNNTIIQDELNLSLSLHRSKATLMGPKLAICTMIDK